MAAYNQARNVSDYLVWMEDAPPHIHNVVQADSTNFD